MMSTADLTFDLSIDDLKGTAGTSPIDIDLIQKGYPLFETRRRRRKALTLQRLTMRC